MKSSPLEPGTALSSLEKLDPGVTSSPPRQEASAIHDASSLLNEYLTGKRLVVFLDYDGTLTPIVENPDDAVLSESMRDTLVRLAKRYTVGIISGRDLEEVRQRVGLESIFYAGSHGFEIAGPEGWHERLRKGEEFLPDLDQAEIAMRKALADTTGSTLERKTFEIAVHYRQVASDQVSNLEATVDQIVARHQGRLRKHPGKKVFQVQPDIDWDKGQAVLWLLEKLDLDQRDVLPIYIGDDTTDEDAFRTLRERPEGGIGIVVLAGGDHGDTAAHWSLSDPKAVQHFLDQLATARL